MQYNQTKYLPNRLTNEPTNLPTNHTISARRVLLENLTVPQQVKETPICYGTYSFINTVPNPEGHKRILCPPIHFTPNFYSIFPSMSMSSKWAPSSPNFPTKSLYECLFSPIYTKILNHLIFLDFINLLIYGGE